MNIMEAKLELWKVSLGVGWTHPILNCVYSVEGRHRVRLNFRDSKILTKEICITTTQKEKKVTGRSSYWEVLEKGEYRKVKIGKNEKFVFPKPEVEKTKKKEPKVKRNKERSS